MKQSVDYEDDLTSWFFIYFGYSHDQKKGKVFIKFQDREVNLDFEDINHAIPKYLGAYVGKDRFYPAFSGEIKNWVFAAGEGSY